MAKTRKSPAKKPAKKKRASKNRGQKVASRPVMTAGDLFPPTVEESLTQFLTIPHWQIGIMFSTNEAAAIAGVKPVTIKKYVQDELVAVTNRVGTGRTASFSALEVMQMVLLSRLSIYRVSSEIGPEATLALVGRVQEYYAHGIKARGVPVVICFYPVAKGWQSFTIRGNEHSGDPDVQMEVCIRIDLDFIIERAWIAMDAALRLRFGKEESKS